MSSFRSFSLKQNYLISPLLRIALVLAGKVKVGFEPPLKKGYCQKIEHPLSTPLG